MMQFNNQKTRTLFNRAMRNLTEEKGTLFAREVKRIGDKKILSDSDDFTITVDDLKTALATI